MSIAYLLVVLTLLGVGLWAFNNYVTAIDGKAKQIINFVVIVIMIIICLQAFGVINILNQPVPRVN